MSACCLSAMPRASAAGAHMSENLHPSHRALCRKPDVTCRFSSVRRLLTCDAETVQQTLKPVRFSEHCAEGCMALIVPDVQEAQQGTDDRLYLKGWHLTVLKGSLQS